VLPSFTLAGIEYQVNERENSRNQIANQYGVDFFYRRRQEVINPVDKDIYIGLTLIPENYNGTTNYMPSVRINQNSIVAPDMKIRQIKAHKYGVFTYMGPHRPEEISSRTLEPIWKYIMEVWMPTVTFELTENFHFEHINYAKCNKHYCECDLFYPISEL
jgi:AraC family transcriptional regulator